MPLLVNVGKFSFFNEKFASVTTRLTLSTSVRAVNQITP